MIQPAMARIRLTDQILNNRFSGQEHVRRNKPRWLRMQMPSDPRYFALRKLVEENNLHTVCQEASCPNMGQCWSAGVATMMILGDTCTRSCGFCHVKTGRPGTVDADEPRRVARAVAIMNLDYVVITSVNRDELADGGAGIWARTIHLTRQEAPKTKIEVLIPDFCGDWEALETVLAARPDVLAHNMETVRRLYPAVRPQARYGRSLELLRRAKAAGFIAKTGIMAGIGETDEEVTTLMHDLVEKTAGDQGFCDILSIGQYLQPSPDHLPVQRFVAPAQFEVWKHQGEAMGLGHVESGPMVRSSFQADRQAAGALAKHAPAT